MNAEWEVIGKTGFQFFGKMSASVSHEIKNALAVMNENAGLLADFAAAAEKGRPIDPSRLKTQAERIAKQIRRADDIVRNMNKFAHSTDDFSKSVDLVEVLELVCALSSRLASMRGVNLTLEPTLEKIPLTTMPFLLENLLWLLLDFAIDSAKADKSVRIRAAVTEGAARVVFSGLELPGKAPAKAFPGEKEKAILQVLGFDVQLDEGAGELILRLSFHR